jgi:hypothetical protein
MYSIGEVVKMNRILSAGCQKSLGMLQSVVLGFLKIDTLMWFSVHFSVTSRKYKEFSFCFSSEIQYTVDIIQL